MGTAFKHGEAEYVFCNEKVRNHWLLGHTVEVVTGFYPIGAESMFFDDEKDDWTFHPIVILEYRLLEAITEKQAKKLGLSITSEHHVESKKRDAKLRWKEMKERSERTGKQPPFTFEDFMKWQDYGSSHQKMSLDEIPNRKGVLKYIEDRISEEEFFYFYVDAQMYFACDLSQKPVNKFDLQELNIYRELANIYGYSFKNSDRIFIRKHNAAKQLYLHDQRNPLERMYAEVFKTQDYDEIETEEFPDGYIWDSFYELYNEIMTQNLDTYPSKETFFSSLIDLGKFSFLWDYGKDPDPDLIKIISEFCNDFPDKETEAYTPLNGFLLSMVKDLEEDLLDKGAAKKCEYCGGIFPFKANKLYCSAISEGRDCGKRARDQRYYIKKSLENPTEN